MDERLYLIDLYDIYGDLLDDKKKVYFEYYYFDNLSLGEISENLNISRNAVHKSLKIVEDKLKFYEEKLELYKKRKELKEVIDNVNDKDLKQKLEDISW
ncbi:MAG: HTH domain-containing protein [Bacilli bacterium]|nr:HTH domain-containing protein [Bacilli bacterium]